MKILVIDDDTSILEALKIIIDNLGHRSTVYKNAARIRDKIDKTKPDIIFFDIILKGVNSTGLIRKLKSEDVYQDIPIILLSANNNIVKCLSVSNADGYLAKPFSIKDFQKVIEKYGSS